MRATIEERGNGWPDVGDYVSETESGSLYRITSLAGARIETHGSGAANTIEAEVEPAGWDDITDAEADAIICTCVVDDDGGDL